LTALHNCREGLLQPVCRLILLSSKCQSLTVLDPESSDQEEISSANGRENPLASPAESVKRPSCARENNQWRPNSLHHWYLITIGAVSAALGIVCLTISALPARKNGIFTLSANNGFVYRFLPTLIAVCYGIPWAILAVDVVRIEPWALLSIPGGRDVSVLNRGTSLVKNMIEAFKNKRRPGGIRWAVIFAITGSFIASAVLNPLSAGLLEVTDVAVVHEANFSTFALPASIPKTEDINDVIFLKSTAALFYEASTSPWIVGSYVVSPFWQKNAESLPNVTTPTSDQLWSTKTRVFQLQLQCEPSASISLNIHNDSQSAEVIFLFEDGCTFTMSPASNSNGNGGGGGLWGQFGVRGTSSFYTLFSSNGDSKIYRDADPRTILCFTI
jgi:hypothetical protein